MYSFLIRNKKVIAQAASILTPIIIDAILVAYKRSNSTSSKKAVK